MKKQLAIWQLIYSSLRKQVPVMLLYVLQSEGSSPGRQGFFMAVNKHGGMEGSIGGGIMEHKFVELARQLLQENNESISLVKKQVHDKAATKNQSGMICSGEQVNFLYRLQKKDMQQVKQLMLCLEAHKDGRITLSPNGFSFSPDEKREAEKFSFHYNSDEDWLYKEQIGYSNQLFIVGGGHCALALSNLMSVMDFYIRLYDTRADLHTIDENHFAHEKYVLKDYSDLHELIPSGENHFTVIMTFGYRTDQVAITALASKRFRYFGVLGSKNKIIKLKSDLEKEGLSKKQLSRLHAPIGLPINSQTPEEIAISIAAEIIKIKNTALSDLVD